MNEPQKLPTRLGKEPIVEAVCEIRFDTTTQLSQVLPGYLFSKLSGDKTLQSMPSAMIPAQIRMSDPTFMYQPLTGLLWNNFLISFSDFSVQFNCQLPYPGWQKFKQSIVEVLNHIIDSGLVKNISRYSLKYMDFIPAENSDARAKLVNIKFSVGKNCLTSDQFQIHLELPGNDCIHLVTIAAPAQATRHSDNSSLSGILITTDSIAPESIFINKTVTTNEFDKLIDRLHDENKKMFFDCLTDSGLESLEPIYA